MNAPDSAGTPMLTLESTFRSTARAAVREVEGELVFVDLEAGVFFKSGGLGPRVWDLIAGGSTLGRVVDEVCSRYGVERDAAWQDLSTFVTSLVEKGFLEAAA